MSRRWKPMRDHAPATGAEMNVEIPRERIEEFCRKWRVSEFALFGSVLRDDFRSDSDVDVLVEFEAGARRGWISSPCRTSSPSWWAAGWT